MSDAKMVRLVDPATGSVVNLDAETAEYFSARGWRAPDKGAPKRDPKAKAAPGQAVILQAESSPDDSVSAGPADRNKS